MLSEHVEAMKLNAISIMREMLIVLSLAIFAVLFVLSFGVVSRMVILHPLFRLFGLGLVYLGVSCGMMLVLGVRKWWMLLIRTVVSGVIAAVLVVVAAELRFTYVSILAKVAYGEGGVVHKVGEARMRSPDCANTYSVYCGNVKYADGSDMRELILLADASVKYGSGIRSPMLLVGKSRILLAHGLSGMRIFPGYAAVTCLGGIDVMSDKVGADARLSITDSGASRTYRCEQREWDKKSERHVLRTHYLDVPLSCFAEVGDEPQEDAVSVDVDGDDWSAAAKFISGPDFLGRALGDQMAAGDEYDVKLEHPFLFLPRASYFGVADGGTVRVKGCMFWFKSPDVEYAIEHVLSPITNALINTYGVPLVMSPDTKRGIFWKRDLSAAHKGQNVKVQVLLEGHGSKTGDGYESCLLIITVMDAHGGTCWSKSGGNWWQSITYHRGCRDPVAVDDWHELSANSVERRRLFSRAYLLRQPDGSYIKTPDGGKALREYASKTFGIPFGIDVRTIDGFGGESISPVGGKFLALEPNCVIATNGWRLTRVNVNGSALTVFGGTVRREFSNAAAAKTDLKQVIGEIESAANISMNMSGSADDHVVAATSPASDAFIEIERIKTATDGSSSYQVRVTRRSLMRLMHIMTTKGCSSRPE